MSKKGHMQQVFAALHDKDYKLTPQRRIVIKCLVENASAHLSAEDVYGLVRVEHPEIGLATVYRTLDLLAALGILQKVNFGDGRSRFEFCEEVHHHHHMVCVRCGGVTEFAEDFLEPLERALWQQNGFKVLDHEVKFFGVCRQCREGDPEAGENGENA